MDIICIVCLSTAIAIAIAIGVAIAVIIVTPSSPPPLLLPTVAAVTSGLISRVNGLRRDH